MVSNIYSKFSQDEGFTLIELLAVMSIVAVLAGIVSTSVSGSGDTSRDAQVKQDSTTLESASADYFGNQEGAAVLAPLTATVLDQPGITQVKSSRWPEGYISQTYASVFPVERSSTVAGISFFTEDGSPSNLTVKQLLEEYNAVDFGVLFDGGFLAEIPGSSKNKTAELYNNYLWLMEKGNAAGSSSDGASRSVAVFKLITVQTDDSDLVQLAYQQLVGTSSSLESAGLENDAPVALDQVAYVFQETPTDISLDGYDVNSDFPLTFEILTPPTHGTLDESNLATPPHFVTYTPDIGFIGMDIFTFTISDGDLSSSPATVELNVMMSP